MEKVSIIIPVYNVGPYLSRCIESLIGQTYQNIEIVLVDDMSNDNSREILMMYKERDSRICAYFQDDNHGVSAARNRGLDESTGEWVCFCDGDDWYEKEYIEKMMECAKIENADYIICDYQLTYEKRSPIVSNSTKGLYSGISPKIVIACGPVSSCTHMIRRDLFEVADVRYPVECNQYEELCVISVLPKYSIKIGVVNKALYNYFQRGNGTSASNISKCSERNFLTSWGKMGEKLGKGYEAELEFHYIYAMIYGEILNACKRGVRKKEIKAMLNRFEQVCSNYLKNPYLINIGKAKYIFLWMCNRRWIFFLRLYSGIHALLVN